MRVSRFQLKFQAQPQPSLRYQHLPPLGDPLLQSVSPFECRLVDPLALALSADPQYLETPSAKPPSQPHQDGRGEGGEASSIAWGKWVMRPKIET